jgi:hypothetical protein
MARAAADLFDKVVIFSNNYTNELFDRANVNYIKLYNIASRYHYIAALGMRIDPKLSSKFVLRMLHVDVGEVKRAVEKVCVIHVHRLVFSYLGKLINMLMHKSIPIVVDLHGSFKLQTVPTNSPKDALAHVVGLLYERIGVKDKAIAAFTVPSLSFKKFMKDSTG